MLASSHCYFRLCLPQRKLHLGIAQQIAIARDRRMLLSAIPKELSRRSALPPCDICHQVSRRLRSREAPKEMCARKSARRLAAAPGSGIPVKSPPKIFQISLLDKTQTHE